MAILVVFPEQELVAISKIIFLSKFVFKAIKMKKMKLNKLPWGPK